MIRYYCILLIFLITQPGLVAQPHRYVVNPASFSTRTNNEFSPVFYKEGIVFCSNLNDNSLVSYDDENIRLFKVFYTKKSGSKGWSKTVLLAREITSGFNDGPVTFNDSVNVVFYSRNNSIKSSMRNISDSSNKLGIYSAELKNGIWSDIKPFIWNDLQYSFGTPALTPDGGRLYFSSDMPGGIGGMDLYYSDKIDGSWKKPVNLGPVINTSKNESFPFVTGFGKLYFASEGHNGLGGKDIFYSQKINGEWITPVHLDSAINSPFDDFGFVSDSTSENGFFSSNRRKSDDIFSFSLSSPPIGFTNCDTIKKNAFCFTFYDEKHESVDSLPLTYRWDFGNDIIQVGKEVRHCFPGPGKYSVKLRITDNLTGDVIAKDVNYNVVLKNIEQALIKSDTVGKSGKRMSFEGLTSDMPGLKFTEYLWDFGEGFIQGGPIMSKSFKKAGEYMIKLGLVSEPDSLGVIQKRCFMKKIKIN